MNELQAALRIVLGNTYVMYAKAQSYHWNVEGMFFPMFHDFFGDIYEELATPIDDIAERIRTLDEYAPGGLTEIVRSATCQEDAARPTNAVEMLRSLQYTNEEVTTSLNKAFQLATAANNQGIADLLAARLDAHAKHAWMIRSTAKTIGA